MNIEYKGSYAYLIYSSDEDKIKIRPIQQVGFKKIGQADYEYFVLEKIPDKEYLEKRFDLKAQRSIVGLGCDPKIIQQHLSKKGIKFVLGGEVSPSGINNDWDCEVTAKIDQIIFRAIAKIAFNYLAYWAGSNFVLDSQFDPVRKYIRFGEKSSYPFVKILEEAILGDEPIEGLRRLGHLIVFDCSKSKSSVVSKVSLFNRMTYLVFLAKDFVGEIFNLRKGSFFNIGDKDIYDLIPGEKLK